MGDETDTLESGQNQQTEGGLPPAPRFAGSGDQRPSTDADATVEALQAKLSSWLDSELEKRLQGQKDRRFSKLEKQFGEVDARLARFATLMETGLKPDQAHQQLEVEEAIEFYRQQSQGSRQGGAPASNPAPGSAEQEQAAAEADQLLKEAGLDNDPAWAEILRARTFKDGVDLLKTAASFVIKRSIQKKPDENPAAIIQPGGGSLPKPDLEAAYWKEVNAAKGQGSAKGREIREKYRKLGLNA